MTVDVEVQTDVQILCHWITGPMYPDSARQRCLDDVQHRGPHWSKTEDVPAGCTCKHHCHCPPEGEAHG